MEQYILSIDAGGTLTRALLLDRRARVIARASSRTKTISPEEGAIEHIPEELYQAVRHVILRIIQEKGLHKGQIVGLGLSVQRATFCLWDRRTGENYTNFISWADVRAAKQTVRMNGNLIWRIIQIGAGILSRITGSTFLIAASQLKFVTDHIISRLLWVFEEKPELRKKAEL